MSTWVEPSTGRLLDPLPSRSALVRSRPVDRAPVTAATFADAAAAEQLRRLRLEVHALSGADLARLRDEVHCDDYRREVDAAVAARAGLRRVHGLRREMSGGRRPDEAELVAAAVADDRVAVAQARLARGERAQQEAALAAAGLTLKGPAPSPARRGGGSMAGLGDLSRPRPGRRSAGRVDRGRLREEIAAWLGVSQAVVASAGPVRPVRPAVCSCGAPGPVEDVRWHESLHRRFGGRRGVAAR